MRKSIVKEIETKERESSRKRQSIHWGIMMGKEKDRKRRSKEANTYPPRIDHGDITI